MLRKAEHMPQVSSLRRPRLATSNPASHCGSMCRRLSSLRQTSDCPFKSNNPYESCRRLDSLRHKFLIDTGAIIPPVNGLLAGQVVNSQPNIRRVLSSSARQPWRLS
jgi:hypothetical protein